MRRLNNIMLSLLLLGYLIVCFFPWLFSKILEEVEHKKGDYEN